MHDKINNNNSLLKAKHMLLFNSSFNGKAFESLIKIIIHSDQLSHLYILSVKYLILVTKL